METIKRPLVKIIIGVVLFLLATVYTPKQATPNPSVKGTITTVTPAVTTVPASLVKVTKVIDGDTIMVSINDLDQAIRLIGVDTPETVDPRKPVQCFGKEASNYVKHLVEGKNVVLDSDHTQEDKDKYNRLLRYVRLEDGTFVNQKIIEDGFGFEYTYNTPYKYQVEFKAAQNQAQATKRGLWADSACPTTPVSTTKPTPTIQLTSSPQTTSWSCNCSQNCNQLSSCDEAYFQLNTCGCSKRDADHDGIPCESLCN